ncbi:site-specific integrase, partial [bacterium]|nr:site-specific integrase [bacterium]
EAVKGSGVWYVFLLVNGRRKSKKIGPKQKAEEVAARIRAKLLLGDLQLEPKKGFTFAEYSLLWIDNYIRPVRRPSTTERYTGILKKYVLPTFGKKPLDKIIRANVKSFLLHLHKEGLSRSTILLCRDVLSGVLVQAIDDELISANPVAGVLKMLKLEREKKIPVEPMTFDEVALFLDTCYRLQPWHYSLFLTAFRTGMRMGEVLAIEWRDIDSNGRFIRVERSFKRGNVDGTKTNKSRRVDMSNQLHDELDRLHTQRLQEALAKGRDYPNNICFHHRDGGHISQNTIRGVFKRILVKAGIRELRFHDIRHTFASLLLTNGESLAYVKEQLGHSSIQMTVDIYGHLIPGSNREAVNRLDTTTDSTYMHMRKKKGL